MQKFFLESYFTPEIFFAMSTWAWHLLPVTIQHKELTLRKITEHTLEIFLSWCPVMISSFITAIVYLLVSFVASLLHISSSLIVAAHIQYLYILYVVASLNTVHFFFTTTGHLNMLNNAFVVRFQLMPCTCKILFV